MIDRSGLLEDARRLTGRLVDDLRDRSDEVDEVRQVLRGEFSRAEAAGRTERAYEDWREDLLAQGAVGWVLGSVFVRFCEDNDLVDTPLLSGPGRRRDIARDHRAAWLGENPSLGDREWLVHVFDRYAAIDATAELFGERNPLRLFGPSADGARALLELWWQTDADGQLVHDFTDKGWDTRFLGDLYEGLSQQVRDTYALLQTPEFVEEFILDRTLDPAIETFGLDEVRMIDPTCGSGHFLLGGFDRLLERWRQREPSTLPRVLAQRVLDAVAGVDLNPFAVSIARFRLLLAALKASSIFRLEDAPAFEINVAVGDSLLHGTYAQTTLLSEAGDPLDGHRYPSEDGRLAGRLLERGRYQAVVGNPPYITARDPALNAAYRSRYRTAAGKYSLAVPFTELFFQLALDGRSAAPPGFVGMITTNSFMKREFGRRLVESYLTSDVDLTHIVDSSKVHFPGPGFGTGTVMLFGRNRQPTATTVRVCLGMRKPPVPASHVDDPVWNAIKEQIDHPGSESEYLSVEDAPRSRYATHPWSLQGGEAPRQFARINGQAASTLEEVVTSIGLIAFTGEDPVYRYPRSALVTRGLDAHAVPFAVGEDVRDYMVDAGSYAVFPYDQHTGRASDVLPEELQRTFWPHRTVLRRRKNYGKTNEEHGLHWWEFTKFFQGRFLTENSILFPFIATNGHFVAMPGRRAANRTAPVISLADGTDRAEIQGLVALLNCSAACFWMKQVLHAHTGSGEAWQWQYEHDATKLKLFPLPSGRPLVRGRELDGLASELSEALPVAVAERAAPTREALDWSKVQVGSVRARMVAVQEELDWECYLLYGLLGEDLTLPTDQLPDLNKGERAFEIVLARRMAAGEVESSWFDRHGSTPITELPEHWPEAYRQLVERRVELITSDRTLGLLERPEYKRRWNWDNFDDLAEEALRSWLLDRLESPELWADTRVTSAASLADRLRSDEEFREVARLYAGSVDADLADVVEKLVLEEAVPYLAAYRLKPAGLRKRKVWEQVWDLQRREDAIDARTQLPSDHLDHLDAEAAAVAKKEQVGKIPVPPKYTSGDFTKTVYWRLRGKLDVPKERFVLLPDTQVGSGGSTVVGWAGWDHLQQAQALSGHYVARKDEGAEPAELTPLLAGLDELVPWLKQWHNEVDPTYGERMGEFFDSFVDTEARTLELTRDDLKAWTPPTTTRRRKKAAK